MGRLGPFEANRIICGDCIEVMAQLPDACVDAIVTDPPYGLEFMGKEWDSPSRYAKPGESSGGFFNYSGHARMGQKLYTTDMGAYQSWTTAWATEAYRILKPGAYMLVMGGTRTHHRLGCGLEDAGFEIRDELAWIYASGFPKNYDVSKGIDKKAGAERTEVVGYTQGVGSPSDHIAQLKPAVGHDIPITVPATPEAEYWEGYGTALKPAHEPIWLCKKPNEGTYVDNVLKHGCGAMNIDGSRIDYQGPPHLVHSATPGSFEPGSGEAFKDYREVHGRWPANVIVDCYPEEFQGGVVIEGEALTKKGKAINHSAHNGFEGKSFKAQARTTIQPDDPVMGNGLLGPYTRFFVIPKPSKREKTCGGKVENKHVTVKPVRLGMWLIKLITPHQHPVLVLDNFCGSGSFLVAAQELSYKGYQIEFYGIDKDEDSVETARARLEAVKAARQLSLL